VPTQDDEDLQVHLVRAMAEGSAEACEALYERHAARLLGVLVKMLGDRDRAEEVLQETFVQAWRTAARFDPERSRVGVWLLLMARSRALDRLRLESRRPPVVSEAASSEGEPDASAAAETASVDMRLDVGRALQGLSGAEREVLAMAYWQGLTQVEIAQRLGIPLGTAKGRVRAALSHLRRILGASEEASS
jgi:RNA polymerase sigma-70 factor (ECF subfamily)